MPSIFRRAVSGARRRIESRLNRPRPPIGHIDFGDLYRTTPISRVFGIDRGMSVDRYYIEAFLAENAARIRGRVLEVGDATYTKRFGGDAVLRSDVLHLTGESPQTTITADLRNAPGIADETFDCVILTQTLHFMYDMEPAISELHRILKPGGSVLCTVPGISQISRYDMDRWGDYWRLTSLSAQKLFESAFEPDEVTVSTYGNVLSATAFLHGLAVAEISQEDLDVHDSDYQLIVAVRATKGAAPRG